jgi:hypothetical protein
VHSDKIPGQNIARETWQRRRRCHGLSQSTRRTFLTGPILEGKRVEADLPLETGD